MSRPEHLVRLRAMLRHRSVLLAEGYNVKRLELAAKRGELLRVAPGQFVRAKEWNALYPSDKHLLRAFCAHQAATSPPIFSRDTSAVILALPLLSIDTRRLHALVPRDSTRRSSPGLIRHRGEWENEEIVDTKQLLHTDLVRTFLDIACSESFEAGVVVGDAALRRLLRAGRGSSEKCKTLMLERLDSRRDLRGKASARRVIHFLEGSAESPLESLFRLQLTRLGFNVRAQVPVPRKSGTTYRMDLELIGHDVFLEADGKVKYTNKEMLGNLTMQEALLNEKYRENWTTGKTGKRVIRGSWANAQTPEATARLLRQFMITPPADSSGRLCADLF